MSFVVRGRPVEIVEAGIIVQGCRQGSKLRVALLFRGGGTFTKGVGTLKIRQGKSGQMCRAGLRKALKAYFLGKRESPLK